MEDICRKYNLIKALFTIFWFPAGAYLVYIAVAGRIMAAVIHILSDIAINIMVPYLGGAIQMYAFSGRLNLVQNGGILFSSLVYVIVLYIIVLELIENKKLDAIKQRKRSEFFKNLI